MCVKVFVLGRPGSGKSTAIQLIKRLADRINISTIPVKDYTILRDMFEKGDTRFQLADWDGFDVTDFSVLDEALKKLEEEVESLKDLTEPKKIVLIEFARDDYYAALQNFSDHFLNDAYFLFIDAKLEEACIVRIHTRRKGSSLSEDRHSVSDEIMRNYYATHNWSSTLKKRAAEGRRLKHVTTLENNESMNAFEQKIISFAEKLFEETIFTNDPSIDQTSLFNNQLSLSDSSSASSLSGQVAEKVLIPVA